MSMTEPNANDSRTDPRPPNGPVSGHAAVGFVVGQRWADGSAPRAVRIVYRRGGEIRTEVVQRESVGQQVEDTPTDSVRFWTPHAAGPHTHMIRADEVLAAYPVVVA
jgi:hypothetical protein